MLFFIDELLEFLKSHKGDIENSINDFGGLDRPLVYLGHAVERRKGDK